MKSSENTDVKKKRIGLYSGSFNPIHLGHTKLAEYVVDNKLVDEVWFVVSPCNPLKKQSELLNEYIRLEMTILAISNHSNFKVSDVEFCMPIPSYSIDTLELLSSQFTDCQFSLIIGSDNALIFDHWKDYSLLLEKYPVLVYPRTGLNFELMSDKYPEMKLLNSPVYDISSTQIRNFIAQKMDASQWLHPSVYQFIVENDFYQ